MSQYQKAIALVGHIVAGTMIFALIAALAVLTGNMLVVFAGHKGVIANALHYMHYVAFFADLALYLKWLAVSVLKFLRD